MQQGASGGGMSRASKVLVIVLISVTVAALLACSTCVVYLAKSPEGGVQTENNIERYATKYIRDHSLITPDEQLIAYYDETLDLDGTSAYIVTNKRVVHHRPSGTVSLDLAKVTDIRRMDQGVMGDQFTVEHEDGRIMTLEVAPANGSELMDQSLKAAWRAARKAAAPASS